MEKASVLWFTDSNVLSEEFESMEDKDLA